MGWLINAAFCSLFMFEGGRLAGRASRREAEGETLGLIWLTEVLGAASLIVLALLIWSLTSIQGNA